MLAGVADKEVEAAKTATPATRRPANKLSTPSRVTAYGLGIAGLGAGGAAVFITHVEAGPVALLAVGLIFMIIALSGRLPTRLRIGDTEAEWQDVAGEVIETALDAASPSTKAEVAGQLRELAEVAPRAAAPALSGLAYENSIMRTIENAANKIPDVQRVLTWVRLEEVGEFDFAIEATNNRFILVEVKASPRLSMAQVASIMEKAHVYREAYPDRKTGLLLVSRFSLLIGVQAMFAQDPRAECVVVRGHEDEDEFISAINRLLSRLEG
jgi:hypothetical protein